MRFTFGRKMKIYNYLSVIALLLGFTAIFLAVTSERPLSEDELNAQIDARIEERERIFVERYSPHVRVIAEDLGVFDQDQAWSPKTIEELITPMVSIIADMEEQSPNKPEVGNGGNVSGGERTP